MRQVCAEGSRDTARDKVCSSWAGTSEIFSAIFAEEEKLQKKSSTHLEGTLKTEWVQGEVIRDAEVAKRGEEMELVGEKERVRM